MISIRVNPWVLSGSAVFLLACLLGAGGLHAADSIDNYALPAKTAFPAAMPRYPNAWFYIDASLAPSFEAAVRLVTGGLRQAMHLPEYYPPFDNPEGCDFEVRVEHLQPWIDPAHRSLQHAHAFHMRYYYNPLVAAGLEKVVFRNRAFYRFAASVHYEVGHANPNHADVEVCPICGRTGEYAEMDPPNAATYQQRFQDFDKRLSAAQQKWDTEMKPFRGRKVVTYHNSLPNFAHHFGLNVIGYVEPRPGIPPTPSHTIELMAQMKRENCKIIMVEPYFDRKTPDSIARETGGTVVEYLPSVGGEKEVTDYFKLFDYDIELLTKAFQANP